MGSVIAKNSSHGSVDRRVRMASASWTCSTAAQSMKRPVVKGHPRPCQSNRFDHGPKHARALGRVPVENLYSSTPLVS
ncbi:hypothetical protein GOBAR_AA26734 [Gossypium barbadense]|uniref:Uncharacterized protein n=1 Tax=Gossypium barbadense TaxID=3634 RepID=A0A2P5WS71_GOSBA|nr:hypothetical protein GOBAR_AA26734 [Gossypium barbadense]